jgi:hypothetical protein
MIGPAFVWKNSRNSRLDVDRVCGFDSRACGI